MKPVKPVLGPPVNSTNVGGAVRIHTVTAPLTLGSTLPGIAQIYYGDRRRWPEIFNANRIGVTRPDGALGNVTNPLLLIPGTHIYIP